jgi:hypothetical protein
MKPLLMAVVLMGVVVGGCATASPDDLGAGPSGEAVAVWGTASCVIESDSASVVEGVYVVEEDFVCELTASDDRISGTETLHVVSRFTGPEEAVWTVEEAVLSTSKGSWRGSAHGALTLSSSSVLPHAVDASPPFNFGEVFYEGEGDLAGLQFHYYFSGSNSTEGFAGWIEGP